MKKLQAFKFELMPTADQELNMAKFAGSCRFVFNKALAWQIEAYAKDKLEYLAVKKMTKSLAGTNKTPLEKIKKRNLNRNIPQQGWHEFARQIEYKMKWSGGEFLKVPAYYTSTTCPDEKCGHISKENRKTQALFKCVACGYENNADLVAAINIEARGHRVLSGEKLDFFACGGGRKRSRYEKPTSIPLLKQEPDKTLEDIPL